MHRALTIIFALLISFVSASAHAAFTNIGTKQDAGGGTCYTDQHYCTAIGSKFSNIKGGPFCDNNAKFKSCTPSTSPSNATCSGTTCTCNTGFNELTAPNARTSCVASCPVGHVGKVNGANACVSQCSADEFPFTGSDGISRCTPTTQLDTVCPSPNYLNAVGSTNVCGQTETNEGFFLTAIVGTIAAGTLAALACTVSALIGCVAGILGTTAAAGILITGLMDGGQAGSAASAAPNGQPLQVSLSGNSDPTKTGVNMDAKGNLTPVGPNWTKNGDVSTTTNSDGQKTAVTTLNERTDTLEHKTTDTQTSKTTTTILSGQSPDGKPIIATAETDGMNQSGGAAKINRQSNTLENPTTVMCRNGTCVNTNNPAPPSGGGGGVDTGGGATGGGTTGGTTGGTGTGTGTANGDCPECAILTNILNTLKGEGTDGAATMANLQTQYDQSMKQAGEFTDSMFKSLMDGLPIKDALENLGLIPTNLIPESDTCSMDVNVIGYSNTFSYCPYQSQIQTGVAFFLFIGLLYGIRDIVFERPM